MLKFENIGSNDPVKVIEDLRMYLNMIKYDILDKHNNNNTIKQSINRRMISVDILKDKLDDYLNQHNIKDL